MAFDEEKPGFLTRFRYPLLAVLVVGFAGYYFYRSSQPLPVGVVEAREGPAERVLAVSGRTRPQVTVTVAPKIPGQILRLTKAEGDSVVAGELLVELEASAPRAALDEAAARITLQQRAVAETERNYSRIEQLKQQGLATIKEFDDARFALDQARLELRSLEATRREVAARLRDSSLRAPVTGVVLARPVDPGQVVGAQSVIYEIAPLSDVEIEADIDEQYLADIAVGQQAEVKIAGQDSVVKARLYYVSPKVDPRTGGAKVRLELAEQPAGLRSGLTADVNLIIERREQALTVARSAILGRDGTGRVLRVRNGEVEVSPIEFIEWPSERVIVLSGVAAGEQLLASPRPDLVGERVLPTTDLASLPAGQRPRGSEARKAL
jgi:RND family efflux transporter MFP subunit